jgi:type II secretory pathway pseudopilin PulG
MARISPAAAEAEAARQRAAANRQREAQANTSAARAAAETARQREAANRFRATQTQATSTTNSGNQRSGASTPITAAPVASTPAAATTAPRATPTTPKVEISNNQAPAIKSAPIDTVEFIDETFSDELIIDLLFEDVGGQELLTIARNDTVNGQTVVYQPFRNLGILQEIYNPTTLLRIQETSDRFFSNFTINLRDKIPNVGSGENGKNYKLDLVSGEGIIEFINIRSDEQVEVQILSAGIIEDIDITESTES